MIVSKKVSKTFVIVLHKLICIFLIITMNNNFWPAKQSVRQSLLDVLFVPFLVNISNVYAAAFLFVDYSFHTLSCQASNNFYRVQVIFEMDGGCTMRRKHLPLYFDINRFSKSIPRNQFLRSALKLAECRKSFVL